MNEQFNFKGGSFKLVLAQPEDSREIVRYHKLNISRLARWEPKKNYGFYREENWSEFLSEKALHYGAGGDLFFLIIYGCQVIGFLSIFGISGYPLFNCTVSYSLDKKYEGVGLMTRSLDLISKWIKREREIKAINAYALKKNTRAINFLVRNGFSRLCSIPEHAMINGKWMDHEFYRKEI
jgi:ribosomal-protein-alanine N-acetyltransferase